MKLTRCGISEKAAEVIESMALLAAAVVIMGGSWLALDSIAWLVGVVR